MNISPGELRYACSAKGATNFSFGLLALLGQRFCEGPLVIDLSGPLKDVDGKRFMFTRGV